jgi:hypothetical protein
MLRYALNLALMTVVAACGGGGQSDDSGAWGAASNQSAGGSTAIGGSTGTSADSNVNISEPLGGSGGAASTQRSATFGNMGGAPGSTANVSTTAGGAGVATHSKATTSIGGSSGTRSVLATTGSTTVSGAGTAATSAATCASLPKVSDYGAPGPFADAKMFTKVGPNANYTLFRPDATLGKGGFLHPIAAWGNGISTTPDMYQKTLTLIASHGFVVIACNDTQAEEPCLSSGLDWLVQQNSAAGSMMGKLDTTNEVAVGYSWGGGAVIDTSVRPNIRATVSLHGMPPREDPWGKVHAPLLLFTSTGDNFVTASEYVTPNYQASTVQTFYATLNDATAGHLYVVDEGSTICIGAVLASTFGNCANAELERAPTVAWLRMWACSDANAKQFFYGDGCILCKSPWTTPQRKNWH